MRQKIIFFICILSICSVLSGCKEEKIRYEDIYIQGQDFQYMYFGNTYENGISMAETEDGYYKLLDNYIYYIEKETMKAVPLCGKTDCLHEKETVTHKKDCNAYIESEDGYVNLYKDQLYVRTTVYDQEEQTNYSEFYAISLDGSQRNKVCQVKEDNIQLWMIHRGKIYYAVDEKGTNDKQNIALKALDLKKPNKSETLFVLDDVFSGTAQDLVAYGNYVYLYVEGFNEDISDLDEMEEENWAEKYENRWTCYHINTGKIMELFEEQKQNGTTKKIVQKIVFWQDSLFYTYYDLEQEEKEPIYKCKLDGTGKQEWMQLEDTMDCFTADSNYFYVYNTWRDAVAKKKEKPAMWVYDKNGKQVDEFEINASPYLHFAPGSEKYFWVTNAEETQDSLVYIEKENIGSLHGKKIEATLCYSMERKEEDTIEEE